MRKLLLCLIPLLFILGCNSPKEVSAPRVDVICLDESLQPYAEAWRVEVARRFPDALVVLGHGGSVREGEWLSASPAYGLPAIPMDQVARHFKDIYPGRPIVLLCCDVFHYHLHVHGVYHALDSVWCVPDRAVGKHPEAENLKLDGPPAATRWEQESGIVGSVFEFVQD